VTDDPNRHQLRTLISACLPLVTLTAALLGPASAPSSASASVVPTSGGTGIDGATLPSTQATRSAPAAPAVPGTATVSGSPTVPGTPTVLQVGGLLSISGHGITLQSPRLARLHGTVTFTGTVAQAKAGETVVIQRQGALPGYWVSAASATIGADGAFVASWHVNQSGSLQVRAVLSSPPTSLLFTRAARATALWATPALTLTVYRGAVATFFGPGFFGRLTACGERLRRGTLGVANRTLPCGSMVAIYYRGRELVVPVIDRGPYAHRASWDLTLATAKALGINQTVRIGTLAPPPAA
jgi:hypothetical protein